MKKSLFCTVFFSVCVLLLTGCQTTVPLNQSLIAFQSSYIQDIIFHRIYPYGQVPKNEVDKIPYLFLCTPQMDQAAWNELKYFENIQMLEILEETKEKNNNTDSQLFKQLNSALEHSQLSNLQSLILKSDMSLHVNDSEMLLQKVQSGITLIAEKAEINVFTNASSSIEFPCKSLTLSADIVSGLSGLKYYTSLEQLTITNLAPLSHPEDGELAKLNASDIAEHPLIYLKLFGVAVENEADLVKLQSLKTLILDHISISDLTWVKKLPNLERIEVGNITGDISFLYQNEDIPNIVIR